MVAWSSFVSAAPELAELVHSRFESHIHHVMGTVRADGAPRLSGTEVHVVDGELTVGMMDDSRKQRDIERDARIELHSNPDGHELSGGDARVAGRLEPTGPAPMPEGADDAPHTSTGTMYRVVLDRVTLIRVRGDQLEIRTWTPDAGESTHLRH